MRRIAFAIAIAVLIANGCAKQTPVAPGIDRANRQPSMGSNGGGNVQHQLLGIWDVTISDDRSSVDVLPLRVAELHLNAVRLLETTPCKTCIGIGKITLYPPNELEVGVTLTHPFPGAIKYTGFDVRGVFMSQADYAFPPSGRSIAWGDGVPRLLNYDGFTQLFNPTEFPETVPGPPALRYIPGMKATGGDLTCTLNPFVSYRKDAPRRMFEAGGSEIKTFRIRAPQGPIHFGYAVNACWFPVEDVIDPLNDFPSDANGQEAYEILVNVGLGLAVEDGGSAPIQVRVLDHQLPETVSSVSIYSPQIFGGEVSLSLSTAPVEPYVFLTGNVQNDLGAPTGTYPLLVRVTDTNADPNLGEVDAWQVFPLRIKVQEGWVRIWVHETPSSGSFTSAIRGISFDSNENIVVTGGYLGSVDFDPGPGENIQTSEPDHEGSFLTKLTPEGELEWVVTWGAWSQKVALDKQNNIYVAGHFRGMVDFDPGPGEDIHSTPDDIINPFVCKFDPDGNLQWARTWGSNATSEYGVVCNDIAVADSGLLYLAGSFSGDSDFDPGPAEDIRTSQGMIDAYLSVYTENGDYLQTYSFGSVDSSEARTGVKGVAVDKSSAVYITGVFGNTVDFDPGAGVDLHVSNGGGDSFLCKFGPADGFEWAETWGSDETGGYDTGEDIAIDDTGNICIVGQFSGDADFDPGPAEYWLSPGSGSATYLTRFDQDGIFKRALFLASIVGDLIEPILTTDCWDNVLIAGRFDGTADFDPGPSEDLHTSEILWSPYLVKLSPSGDFIWAESWTGSGWLFHCDASDVETDPYGNIYLGGEFTGSVDFDPGPGVEEHKSPLYREGYLNKITPDGTW